MIAIELPTLNFPNKTFIDPSDGLEARYLPSMKYPAKEKLSR